MKNKILPILALSAFCLLPVGAAPYVQDFQSFSTGNLTSGSGSLLGSPTDGNPIFRSASGAGASTGIREVVDESGNKFVRLARNFSTSQGLTIGELITLSDAGLTDGQAYELSLDYRIGRVGTEDYQNVEFRFGAMEDNGGFAQFTQIEGNLTDFNEASQGGTILHNYSDTTFTTITPASQPVSNWTNYTFTNSFTYTAGNPTIGWLLIFRGLGSGNAAWDGTNYTYIDVDNVTIAIPEPSTWVLLAAAGTFLVVFRRRRAAKNVV